MLEYRDNQSKEGGIAIIGIGGAGANVLKCFNSSSADKVRLYIMSLDERMGRTIGNVKFVQLGEGLSHGLGSGGDPEVGKQAIAESEQRVSEVIGGSNLVVMVVGLGGGTGSGAAPELARMAHEQGIFLVSVLMMPFSFEGKRRIEQAAQAHEQIARFSDIVFCFENDYMEELFRDRSGAREVFEEVDRLLAKATASVPMMATSPGLINLGLDELAVALENSDSRCLFGSGSGYGAGRAEQAARAAVESPLCAYHGAIRYARKAIVHIAGGDTLSISEIRQAMEVVRESFGNDDVQIFFGTSVKANLGDEVRVTLIASIDAQEFKAACAAVPAPVRPDEDDVAEPDESEVKENASDTPREDVTEQPDHEDTTDTVAPDDDVPDDDHDSVQGEEPSDGDESATDDEEEQVHPESQPAPAPTTAAPSTQVSHQLDLFSAPAPTHDHGTYTPPVAEVQTGILHERHDQGFSDPKQYNGQPTDSYTPVGGRRPNSAAPLDDLDTPPSMRHGNMRDDFSHQ